MKGLLGLLLVNRFLILGLLIGALIAAGLARDDPTEFVNEVEARWINVRAAAIAIYSIAIGASLLVILLEFLNCCVGTGSRAISFIVNSLDLLLALAVLGISIPMIVAETNIPEPQFLGAVNRRAYLASGILGTIAVAFYVLDFFLSRFLQFSILGASFMRAPGTLPYGPTAGYGYGAYGSGVYGTYGGYGGYPGYY